MCFDCWEELGRPSKVTPQIRDAADKVKALYSFTCTGGNLHIVTDDWNLEDNMLEFCREAVTKIRGGDVGPYDDANPEQLAIEASILDLMEPMTVAERGTALALADDFI